VSTYGAVEDRFGRLFLALARVRCRLRGHLPVCAGCDHPECICRHCGERIWQFAGRWWRTSR
jgi:hypothetical protein